jgi:dTDP-4-dehydrorhamnose reductase/SAM-dependent methyltransferase
VCDIGSIQRFFSSAISKEIRAIIHLASVNLRESEQDPGKAIRVNIQGTLNMLNVAINKQIPFVFVSSGAVFSDRSGVLRFNESYPKNPNSVYGQTKDCAEEIVKGYSKSIIVRTGWLFGGTQSTHHKFIDNAILKIKADLEVRASYDFYGSFTYVKDFIDKMFYLLDNRMYGLYHIINDGVATGYEASLYICELLKKDSKLVIAVQSKDVPNAGPPRSKSEMLINSCSQIKLRDYKQALKEYLSDGFVSSIGSTTIVNRVWHERRCCRLCRSEYLSVFFCLEPTPLANHFHKETTIDELIPLDIAVCNVCKHIQLMQIVDPNVQYRNYLYLTGTSKIMTRHLLDSIDEILMICDVNKEDNILEIGANDGTVCRYLIETGYLKVIGVDPAVNINRLNDKLPIICDFFDRGIIDRLSGMRFKLIYSFHACAHIEAIDEVFETVSVLLSDGGFFVMEVGYFYDVFNKKTFDVIYHEHIDYHTCTAMSKFCIQYGLILTTVKLNDIQGGSIQFFFTKGYEVKQSETVTKQIDKESSIYWGLNSWKNNIIRNGEDVYILLSGLVSNGKKVAGYGASAKLTTFFYQYRLNSLLIRYIIDDNPMKQGLKTPGHNIDIYPLNHLEIDPVDYIVIFAWNVYEEILPKLGIYRKGGLRVIIPHPNIILL